MTSSTVLLYVLMVCGKPDFFMGVNGVNHLEHGARNLTHDQKKFYSDLLHSKGVQVIYINITQGVCV